METDSFVADVEDRRTEKRKEEENMETDSFAADVEDRKTKKRKEEELMGTDCFVGAHSSTMKDKGIFCFSCFNLVI